MLHITNGDAAGALISRARFGGYVLPWNDVLHEGAVRCGLTLDELSDERARFIAACGWEEPDKARAEFRSRDERLKRSAHDGEIVLWFEHDLYDQLQLLQLLDYFSQAGAGDAELKLICIGEHDEVADFHGLGQLSVEQIAALFPARSGVTAEQLALGRRAWAAFGADDPRRVERLLAEDASALPFLSGALRRHLQQFPSATNGLSRTEASILGTLDGSGRCDLPRLFDESQRTEEARFLGDSTFVGSYLAPLCRCAVPLVRVSGGEAASESFDDEAFDDDAPVTPAYEVLFRSTFEITDAGRDVLRGRADHVELNGINLWRGGVRLLGRSVWRWDADADRLVAPA